jgi:hypothetical protein
MDVARLAELLHETAEHHDPFEKSHAAHDWWDWYAAYLAARLEGSDSAAATEAARELDEVIRSRQQPTPQQTAADGATEPSPGSTP